MPKAIGDLLINLETFASSLRINALFSRERGYCFERKQLGPGEETKRISEEIEVKHRKLTDRVDSDEDRPVYGEFVCSCCMFGHIVRKIDNS